MAEIRDSIAKPLSELRRLADEAPNLSAEIRAQIDAVEHEIIDLEVSLEDAQFDGPYDDGPSALELAEQLADKLRTHPQDTVRRVCDCLLSGSGSDLWQVLGS